MAQIIKLKRGTSAPTTTDIVDGEVAIDTAGRKLYINASGTIKEIGSTSDASLITSGSVALQEFEYTATSNQTTFSGADTGSQTLSYFYKELQVHHVFHTFQFHYTLLHEL